MLDSSKIQLFSIRESKNNSCNDYTERIVLLNREIMKTCSNKYKKGKECYLHNANVINSHNLGWKGD